MDDVCSTGVRISVGTCKLDGELLIPSETAGSVIFAHGSGSGRFSPRNRFVAQGLAEAQMTAMLVDLLTSEEQEIDSETGEFRFEIDLLAGRLIAVIDWLSARPELAFHPLGLFGSSTGAAAAFMAAAERPRLVKAIVSRGGRPDLAGEALHRVKAATLFIVGANDYVIHEVNNKAFEKIAAIKGFEIVSGAGHLFEEHGAMEEVLRLSREFFLTNLAPLDQRYAV